LAFGSCFHPFVGVVTHQEGAESLTGALRDLYGAMDATGNEVLPIVLLRVLHLTFPRFAEKGAQGGLQQQDANECWTELLRMLQQKLKTQPGGVKYVFIYNCYLLA